MVKNGFEPAKTKDVCRILSKDYNMVHRRPNKIQRLANADRALVLRHRFARCMLDQFMKKKRVLIIDETVLGESNWQSKTWQGRAYSVS